MTCPQCRRPELRCPACEHANPLGSRFCNTCGHGLTAPASPERHRESRIGRRLVIVGVTIVAILALLLTIRVGPFDRSSTSDRLSPPGVGAGLHEIEGSVKKVEPDTRTIHVSSGILGLVTTRLALSDETLILVGDKEGALGDLHEGGRVWVSFDARPDTRAARVIEVLIGGVGARRPRWRPESSASAGIEAAREPEAAVNPEAARPAPTTRIDADVEPRPPISPSAAPVAVTPKPAGGASGPTTDPASDPRHSGTVVDVGHDRLVVDELGPAGEAQELSVTVTPDTRIIESERNPRPTDTQDGFTATPTTLTNITKGDYVVIDVRREGKKLVARSVMVTLRRGKN